MFRKIRDFQVIQESLLADGGFAYVQGSPAAKILGPSYGDRTHLT